MKNSKQKKKYIEYKINKKVIVLLICVSIIVITLGYFYMNNLKKLVYENIYKNLDEFSEQIITQLSISIKDQKDVIDLLVEYINKGYIKTMEDFFDMFKESVEEYNFTRIAIVDENGNGKTIDGYDVINYPNIAEFFEKSKEEVYLTENRQSVISNETQVNIYSRTCKLDGKEMLLMATVYTSDYQKLLIRRLFGKGGSYLISNNGTVLIDSFNNIKDPTQNLYSYFKEKYSLTTANEMKKIDELRNAILKKEEGTFDIDFIEPNDNRSKRETYFIHYGKLDINDWYVVTTASDSTIANGFIRLEFISTIFYSGIICIIVAISIYGITSNEKKNRKIYKIAYKDLITGLGNENYFKKSALVYLENNPKEGTYVLTLDIDKFKALNTIYGYETCNEILKLLGQKLQEILPEDNITCRISNDIFASIFSFEKDIKEFLEKILEELISIKVGNINLIINVSIGVYQIAENEKNINKILDKSYLARTQVKGMYDCNYYLFDEKLEDKLLESQKLEAGMKHGLEANEFFVYYQPKIIVKNEKIYGAEALVRWYKDGELIPPSKFIPLFEKNKFILKLDLYIFEKVCQDIAKWKEKYDKVPIISVNVSKENFADENFIEKYVQICNKYNIATNTIDLEITESAMINEDIDILAILNRIKQKGFIISLDDFGTGYSSLYMLQNMPIDIIKVDKSFIDNAVLDKDDNIINYIMLIAKHLGYKTIIEGVETKEQYDFIKHIEGDIIQGYYYSKPLTKEDFESYYERNK